jgi:hypothetical protein
LASAETASLASSGGFFREACRRLEARELRDALALFNAAERAGFNADECGGGRWFCRMLAGDFEEAWRESDRIAVRGAPDSNKLWSGRPLEGKNVIVRCLHGLGDAIQFIRFAVPLKARVDRLFVEVPGCLVRLFQTIPEIDQVFSWDDPHPVQPDWDEHIEVMELPRYFRVTAETLPSKVPYVFPPDGGRIPERETALPVKVGVAWSASDWNPSRSLPLPALLSVLSTAGCQFVSLQKGIVEEDGMNGVPLELRPHHLISETDDVQATASFVKQVDLVIAVDTMVAHLAGALGKPVWLMLEKRADWRWMMERTDSPWYPTLRIFRQTTDGCWGDTGERIAAALRTWVTTPRSPRTTCPEMEPIRA